MIYIAVCFFFNDTATTEIYTLSLHDALPISVNEVAGKSHRLPSGPLHDAASMAPLMPTVMLFVKSLKGLSHTKDEDTRSEEHTSELQSRQYLVCRLLLAKKNGGYPRPRSVASSGPPLSSSAHL